MGEALAAKGIEMIDCAVSGGLPGAQNGTLTLMASGKKEVYDDCADVMAAIATNPNHVGTEPVRARSSRHAFRRWSARSILRSLS